MITVEKLKAEHLKEIMVDESVAYLRPHVTDEAITAALCRENSFAAIYEGKVVACAGVTEYWPGRGEVWAILSSHSRTSFLAVHNAIKRFLENCNVRRLEYAVEMSSLNAHKWAKFLGFEMETPRVRGYLPDGRDVTMYVRIK